MTDVRTFDFPVSLDDLEVAQIHLNRALADMAIATTDPLSLFSKDSPSTLLRDSLDMVNLMIDEDFPAQTWTVLPASPNTLMLNALSTSIASSVRERRSLSDVLAGDAHYLAHLADETEKQVANDAAAFDARPLTIIPDFAYHEICCAVPDEQWCHLTAALSSLAGPLSDPAFQRTSRLFQALSEFASLAGEACILLPASPTRTIADTLKKSAFNEGLYGSTGIRFHDDFPAKAMKALMSAFADARPLLTDLANRGEEHLSNFLNRGLLPSTPEDAISVWMSYYAARQLGRGEGPQGPDWGRFRHALQCADDSFGRVAAQALQRLRHLDDTPLLSLSIPPATPHAGRASLS